MPFGYTHRAVLHEPATPKSKKTISIQDFLSRLEDRVSALKALRDNSAKNPWNVHLSIDVHIAELRSIILDTRAANF